MRVVPSKDIASGVAQTPITVLMTGLALFPLFLHLLGRLLVHGLSLLHDLGWDGLSALGFEANGLPSTELSQPWGRDVLPLSWSHLRQGEWWRLASFPISSPGIFPSALSAIGLWILGRCAEPIVGSFRLLMILLASNTLAGVAHCAASALGLMTSESVLLHGMAPTAFSLLGAYGSVIPDWPVGAATRWRIPRLRARHVPRLAIAGALVLWICGAYTESGPLAMACATLVGWSLTRAIGFGELKQNAEIWRLPRTDWERIQAMSWSEFVTKELDPVLDKIARSGLESLTKAERRVLKAGQWRLRQGGPDP